MQYESLSAQEKDYTAVLNTSQRYSANGACMYCNHCLPCPAGIDIASVNRYLDIARLDRENVPPSVRQHYETLKAGGGSCISCGSCEERCPFEVRVISNMAEAAEVFGR